MRNESVMGQGNDHTLARYGQGLVEYALIMLLIAIAVFVAVTLFGVQLQATYLRIAASVNP